MTWVKKLDQGTKEVYAAACSRDNLLFARGFAVLRFCVRIMEDWIYGFRIGGFHHSGSYFYFAAPYGLRLTSCERRVLEGIHRCGQTKVIKSFEELAKKLMELNDICLCHAHPGAPEGNIFYV
ncbi:hypothetical protein I7I53_08490 [Histoplasma capsulatum var. duboisii H88]|nr:hypothetical protein I7I53_08490 [Histoplasma capsulatum var. duboisii H88]